MTDIILHQDIESLLQGWMKAEQEGEEFPVPLHDHWSIAGHTKKQRAFELAESILEKGVDYYLPDGVKNPGRGRPRVLMFLTFAGLEHLCMAAKTSKGRMVREVYRQAKNKWDEVQKQYPGIAQEIELQMLRNKGLELEYQKIQADLQLTQFRHIVSTTLPEPIQQKILGYKEIKTTEYVPQTITPEGERLDGCGITYLQKRYGFKSTSATWAWLDSIGFGKDSGYWQDELVGVTRPVLPRGILNKLDDLSQGGLRQRFFGE